MTAANPRPSSAAAELRLRMRKPQRHRLLHGYPLAAAMPSAEGIGPHADIALQTTGRGLLVGVLPHPFCNPAVTGCGYCTFPHEPGNATKATAVVEQVLNEIEAAAFSGKIATLSSKQNEVTALYFGGGTANMVEPEPFRELCDGLEMAFNLKGAEVTLEGVPAYFLRGAPLLADVMRETLPARHFRLSMGVQTFDEARLRQMGRAAFGTPDTFRQVVDLAHSRGFTISADFLFNLPGQTLDEMKADVRRAIDLGLDHLGLYHLVMFAGLGTAWSEDDNLLAELPDNERAAANWVELRVLLLENGFVQISLTNFERAEFRNRPERYVYEDCSFQPDGYEAIGFGPSAASYVSTADFQHGVKTINPTSAGAYTAAVKKGGRVWDRYFAYAPRDQRVFWLTRRLARLDLDRARYRELFGVDMLADFPDEFAAIQGAGLIEVDAASVRPTPIGMFYADSIAAVLAAERIREIRALQVAGQRRRVHPALLHDSRANANAFGHM